MQHDIHLTHEVLESEALKLLQDKLNCDIMDSLGHTIALGYKISKYQFSQTLEDSARPAYNVVSRGTIKSDAGPRPNNLSSFYAIVSLGGRHISDETLAEIKEGLERLVAN